MAQIISAAFYTTRTLVHWILQTLWSTIASKTDEKTQAELHQESTAHMVTLPNGRKLAYTTYGDKIGFPVLYLHGFPGSRLEGQIWHESGVELGARIIAVDRPGVGHSDPQPRRSVLSHAQDLIHVAAQLDLEAYSVIGTSGGGPYALACGHMHSPDALKSVALVCGMGSAEIGTEGMSRANQVLFWCFRNAIWVARLIGWLSALNLSLLSDDFLIRTTEKRLKSSRLPDKDKEVLGDSTFFRSLLRSSRQFFLQGPRSFAEEGRILASPIGFDLGTVQVPIELWYGLQDQNVPVRIGEAITEQLSASGARLRLKDETHLSMIKNCQKDVLKGVLPKV
jgi:pimeloyl-ACP methyl ester carboxylesterase